MSDEQTLEQNVKDCIDKEIRPMLQSHGGDCEFISLEDNKVSLRLQGACSGCPGAAMTLKMGVERVLKERVPEVTEVIALPAGAAEGSCGA